MQKGPLFLLCQGERGIRDMRRGSYLHLSEEIEQGKRSGGGGGGKRMLNNWEILENGGKKFGRGGILRGER